MIVSNGVDSFYAEMSSTYVLIHSDVKTLPSYINSLVYSLTVDFLRTSLMNLKHKHETLFAIFRYSISLGVFVRLVGSKLDTTSTFNP